MVTVLEGGGRCNAREEWGGLGERERVREEASGREREKFEGRRGKSLREGEEEFLGKERKES